ncbi:MAG: radical SAM protein [Candidatus Eiseniibacteriota bacterium]|nr:MAG: radical SAM protein [Candidatus Eisenbacteria bacterium]
MQTLGCLSLILTAQCNQRCAYCYQNAKKPLSMSWEVLKASLDMALEADSEKLDLVFLGGEPLLEFPAIRRAVRYVAKKCPPEKGVNFELITNGLLLAQRRVDFLIAHNFGVKLSFDGAAEAQESRSEGSFGRLDRLLEWLKSERPGFFRRKLRVAATLTPSTVVHLSGSVDYLIGRGVREFSVSPAVTDCSEWKEDDIQELDSQMERVYESCLRHYRLTGEVPLQFLRKTGDDVSPRKAERAMCGVMSGHKLTVDVDGEVYGCTLFARSYQGFPSRFLEERLDPMRMGDLRAPGFLARYAAYPEAVRRAEIFHHREKKYSSHGRCDECEHVSTCGICPVSIGHAAGNTDPHRVPDFQCAFARVVSKYRARFPEQPGLLESVLTPPGVAEEMERWRILAEAARKGAASG